MQYKVGDWLYYKGSKPNSGIYLRQIVSLHDDSFRSKGGFSNKLQFYRKAEPHEIPGYEETENYKYLVKLLKKLKIK